MATAETRTLLSLDRFFQLVSYSPIFGNQVVVPAVPLTGAARQSPNACSDPILQYTWQPLGGGRPGREEIAQAIEQAEQLMEMWLGFPAAPKWVADDQIIPVRQIGSGYGGYSWFWNPTCSYQLSVKTSNKHVIQGGIEAWSVISAGAAVVYTDTDNDGYFETATVTVNTTITDDDDIAVYYPGVTHDPAWEIRPISVAISGGVATITFTRQQAVLQDLLTALQASAVDGLIDANFLTTVDVYRHYNDPSTMAIVEWSPSICDNSLCQVSAQTACISQVDARNGQISIHAADWDADTSEWTHVCPTWWVQPTRVRAYYRAGLRDHNLPRPMWQMDRRLERAIAYLALSMMDRPWMNCEPMNNLQTHWRTDLSLRQSTQSSSSSFARSPGMLNNPLGSTRAADYAWRVVQQLAVGDAVTAQ